MSDYYSGRVQSVVFENPGQSFYILKIVLDEGDLEWMTEEDAKSTSKSETVTAKGHVSGISVRPGVWFGFEAKWITHEKFGQQLDIQRAPVIRQDKWDADTVRKLLTTSGVNVFLANRIFGHFTKDRFIEAVEKKEVLMEMPDMDEELATYVVERWLSARTYYQTLNFLQEADIPKQRIQAVWNTFGEDTEVTIRDNPWALVQVDGITFEQADAVARKMAVHDKSDLRHIGLVVYMSKTQKSMGHLYVTAREMCRDAARFVPEITQQDVARAIVSAHKKGLLVLDRLTRPGTKAVYEPWFFEIERDCADLIHERVQKAVVDDKYLQRFRNVGPETEAVVEGGGDLDAVVNASIREWGLRSKLALSSMQLQGVKNALQEPVTILTGLPGTGKTTSLKAVVHILQDLDVRFLLVAPTGIASKRLSEATNASAFTIHRAFSAKKVGDDDEREAAYVGILGKSDGLVGSDGSDQVWGYSPDHPHEAQVIIIDESSMVDQNLLYRILTCTSPKCRIVFVGDAAQLPSVGPGNVLRDLITAGVFPVIALEDIFRQEDTSDIIFAAHDIHKGKTPQTPVTSDFTLLEAVSERKVQQIAMKVAERLYNKKEQFQVLSPRHGGVVGVTTFNSKMRDILNPPVAGLREIKIGNDIIRVGDRVMVVKNNYELGVFNGDIGKVTAISMGDRSIQVKIFGNPDIQVTVTFTEASIYLRLAYACTVHKFQGLEIDNIVLPVVDSFGHQLQRNLYYTAITRAKKKVILIGTRSALQRAVINNKEDQRNTLFLDRIVAAFG